jgi:Ion channel
MPPMLARLHTIERRFFHVRERLGDWLLTWLTILLLVLTFGIVPLHASGLIVVPGYGLVIILIMASCIVSAPTGPSGMIAMLLGIALGLAAIVMRHMGHPRPGLYLDAAAWSTVAVTLAYVIARAVFAPGRITYHRVNGAVLLYLTIGQIFVGLYGVIDLLAPHAFSGLNVADRPKLVSDLIYFSFVTLTTVGYGDIVPVHPLARSLSNLEAIIGQLYPATLLARLVTLELEGRRR